jgi:AbrB family looped-hinge helix DNA binding protein
MARNEEYATNSTFRTRLTQNGRVVIPAGIRDRLGLHEGDEIVMQLKDGEVRMTTQQLRIRQAQRRAAQRLMEGPSLVDELLEERRRESEWERQ